MANSLNNYAGTGATTDFSVTFPYMSSAHIEVYVDGVVQVYTADYVLQVTPTVEVQFVVAPASGADIWIIRNSDVVNAFVSYVNPATLTDVDLNNHLLQNLYLEQERREQTHSAGLYTAAGAAAQVGLVGGVWTKMTGFALASPDNRIAYPDTANNQLIFPNEGLYWLAWSMSFHSSVTSDVFFAPHLAGARQDHIRNKAQGIIGLDRTVSAASSLAIAAGDAVDLRANPVLLLDLTPVDLTLSVHRIGDV